MSLVTVTQVNPNDEVTASSVNTGPNQIAAVVNGNIDDANVSTLSGTKISAGTIPSSAFDTASNPESRELETTGNLVSTGAIWSITAGLVGSMSAGVAYVNGKRVTPVAVPSYSFTASRDTYIYIDDTGTVQYSAQSNGANQPMTASNNVVVAKVVTSGSAITNIFDLRPMRIDEPWRTFVPAFTNFTLGNGTVNLAKYKRVGTNVDVKVRITIGSTSIVGTDVKMFLPIPTTVDENSGVAPFNIIGTGILYDMGTANYIGYLATENANSAWFLREAVSGSNTLVAGISATTPMTWATGDVIYLRGRYEAV